MIMAQRQAPSGGSVDAESEVVQDYQRLKPNTVGYLFATVVLTIFTVGYVAMARYITAAGAFYGYISHGLGQVVGMASGLLACLAYIVFEASLIGIFSSFAETTFKAQLGLGVPWQAFAIQ
jgi:amino acid transporter